MAEWAEAGVDPVISEEDRQGASEETDRVADTEEPQDTATPPSEDVQQLKQLYDLMQQEGLETLELEDKNTRIQLTRPGRYVPHEVAHVPHRAAHPHSSTAAKTAAVYAAAEATSSHSTITTPLAGVLYRASSPSSAPYVSEGSVVEPGQTLCIVEAMKVMNEIKAETRCKIVKISAENSRPVTAGQTLFLVEPA